MLPTSGGFVMGGDWYLLLSVFFDQQGEPRDDQNRHSDPQNQHAESCLQTSLPDGSIECAGDAPAADGHQTANYGHQQNERQHPKQNFPSHSALLLKRTRISIARD